MGYPTLNAAIRAWEDAISNNAIGPAAKPCKVPLPSCSTCSAPRCRISPMTTPLSSLSASHRAPEKLSQSAKGLPPSSSFPRSSSSPSPLSRRTPSPLPPTPFQQRFSVPRFAEVIVGSSASRLRDIMASFETEPLPYYAVLRGQCPGVYYGR